MMGAAERPHPAEQVVRQAACPVLTVKMPFPEAVPEQDQPLVEPAQA